LRVALVGSPNSGKTSLFNALTGMRQKVANHAGVTVDAVEGLVLTPEEEFTLVDLPGIYSMEPLSPDEHVTVDVLHGRDAQLSAVDAVVVVADSTLLARSLALVMEIMELGKPTALVVTMLDELKARGGALDIPALKRELRIPVVGVVGNKGLGVDDLRIEFANAGRWPAGAPSPAPADTAIRFIEVDRILEKVIRNPGPRVPWMERMDRWVLHPIAGPVIFSVVMVAFFQIIFTVAAPLQELSETAVMVTGQWLGNLLPDGFIRSLVVDGVFAGVGGVVVFVPQIALLLFLITFMEGTGYLSRAAFIVDRLFGRFGLEGRSFVALLSSYACAVPGIMATRTIPDARTRLATMLAAPLMTCSARLPVYTLLIAAFVPQTRVAGLSLQGLVMFGLYLLGSVASLIAAAAFRRGSRVKMTYPFYMELPPYRLPTRRMVWQQVWGGVSGFLRKAGTTILVASMVLWALLTFPQVDASQLAAGDTPLDHTAAATMGKWIEPVIEPLGFDWRIGIGLIASLAAREVVVSTMSQVYAFEVADDDLATLSERLSQATDSAGDPLMTLPIALSLMIFFVFALQCVSTLAVLKRESGGWAAPVGAFVAYSLLAWIASFATYNLALALLG
jgi:ferrous iron transport protein B